MVITVDGSSSDPIYQQLRSQVIAAIASGELSPGDPMPSVRSLAGDLGINLHTVNKAYAVLRDEGYLLMRGRAGAVVADRGADGVRRAHEEQEELMAEDLRRLVLAHKARGGSRAGFLDAVETALDSVFEGNDGMDDGSAATEGSSR
ncbi:MAG: GntR family transcriptional regulator [Atopobiaceae bacterium]|jgi:DNA-binding transcriptional regulator YhcF (GntR family)|nr:GntR family transcriptional regulator [Atopobiaceae bacterium]MCI2172766.1 GntR family transcriptional regulator [Atopobiaceae bacterium]MCI2207073.1 GntR family transcriptional regulator [Atopobiaceae bacterium]